MNPYNALLQTLPPASQLWSIWLRECWPVLLLEFALMVIAGWVVYVFYARLRDIASELKKLRVAYENSNQAPAKSSASQGLAPTPPVNPDARFMPKKWEL